jgi:hypothetical protein
MASRISVIPDADRTRWIVKLNGQEVIAFQGPDARSCAEHHADALEEKLTVGTRARSEVANL